MDSIVASALEEICAKGQSGLGLSSLWSRLAPSLSASDLDLSPGVKKSVWANLLNVPAVQFLVGGVYYSSDDPAIQSFEDAEKLSLKIVAKEQLRDNFVGLYDDCSANAAISSTQRRALERLAIARTNGITQSDLCKEFGMEGNNMYYVVRNLECRGLIVRPDAIVRTKEASEEGDMKNNSSVASTKLLYLYRYAKHLSSEQRFEITKEEKTLECLINGDEKGDGELDFAGGGVKNDVCVKDYQPQMKAICDKLEGANGKVLVVSDIKQDLGYVGSPIGHKAWRKICGRLKQADIVEEFEAKVNDKVERCLRLLNKQSSNIEPKTLGSGEEKFEEDPLLKFGRRFQITDQLVDLAIERQIYDMIDSEGSDGILGFELSSRIGLGHKRNQARLENMSLRFGAVKEAENVKKGKAYRFWTSGNFNSPPSIVHPYKSKIPDEIEISNANGGNEGVDTSSDNLFKYNPLTSENDRTTPEKLFQSETEMRAARFHEDGMAKNELLCHENLNGSLNEPKCTVPDAEVNLFCTDMEIPVSPPERTPTLRKCLKSRSSQRHPGLTFTVDSARREQRIIERLKDDKFILRAELYRWLVNFEKDKDTTMDRRTIDRILNKLQLEGHCKCIQINFPAVTNCGGSRIIHVILHPSVQSLLPELHGDIHDRLRSFEMQIRGHGSLKSRDNESLPVLDNVQRSQGRVNSDAQAVRSEAMRTNGFVLAKMVRTKLLHSFLWSYLSSSPGWDAALSSGKHGADNLFSLEEVIKALPLELFLQVAGSSQKFDDMVDKCKRGLCLSDLPVQEYKHLMDTKATGRLSVIIDILRRLKLVRLVSTGHSDDGLTIPHATFTHALELKPYIEEPQPFISASSDSRSLDLRPHIRHDFTLSSRKAVDEYWQTLEFCYAAVDPRTALHAFPGSAVHEAFVCKSWASIRVMSASQRTELIKQIEKVNLEGKFTMKDCQKIAKDLNLTIEQVLRVHYDKRRLDRYQGALNANGDDQEFLKRNCASSSRKRKRSVKPQLVKRTRHGSWAAKSSDAVNKFGAEPRHLAPYVEHDLPVGACPEDGQETIQEPGSNENDECYSVASQCAPSKMKPKQVKRFSWTDKADRQLVIQYVRNRVSSGPKFHRTDWASLPDLPGPPITCGKRMSSLNRNTKFRRAVMRLCNVLTERYLKYLERIQNRPLSTDDQQELNGSSSAACHNKSLPDGIKHIEESELDEGQWDDFHDPIINTVLEEVLRLKQVAKLDSSKMVEYVSNGSDLNKNSKGDTRESGVALVATPSKNIPDHAGEAKGSVQTSRCHRLHQNFIRRLNEGISVTSQVHESLAISSAVELLKLVFLSTSTSPEVANQLAETLRRYSEHDLFAAYSYLKEKKFMIGGDGGPFVLSQYFLHRVYGSPFPTGTGERAAKFSNWLNEREKDLLEGRVDLTADLQCGDIFHLFALVSSGELSVSPCLPDEGVGEAEDLRGLKRRSDNNDSYDGDTAKKLKSLNDAELISRREKGFPGIMVSVHQTSISTANGLDLFKDSTADLFIYDSDASNTALGEKNCCNTSLDDHIDLPGVGNVVPLSESSCESSWEIMAGFAERWMLKSSGQKQESPFHPKLFQAVYTAIQKAGDQGLSIEQVSKVIDVSVPGEKIHELVIDVLQAFGQALKVNAHDSVRIVDALYRSKYLVTSKARFCQNYGPSSPVKTTDEDCCTQPSEKEISSIANLKRVDNVHKVTILNLPGEVHAPLSESQASNMQDGCMVDKVVLPEAGNSYKPCQGDMPILPWVNGDGTINSVVYRGLTRRVLGTVMQNPGILEDDIIHRMNVLNPQSCRTLLKLMILDNDLVMRKIQQSTSCGPPSILSTLVGGEAKFIFREHYFANPMSTSLL